LVVSGTPTPAGEELVVFGYGVIAPSQAALEATAALAGIELEHTPDGTRLRIPTYG